MAKKTPARRYSQAVFQIALERDELDRWQSDLRKVASLRKDSELVALIENPKVHFSNKQRLLSERLGDVNPLALNLVYLLIARDSLNIVEQIAEEYQQLLDSYRGIEQAEVITAIPLDDEDKARLGERLGALVGKKLVIEPKVDPGLIGGIKARIGSKLFDGSTRNRLDTLKRQLGG